MFYVSNDCCTIGDVAFSAQELQGFRMTQTDYIKKYCSTSYVGGTFYVRMGKFKMACCTWGTGAVPREPEQSKRAYTNVLCSKQLLYYWRCGFSAQELHGFQIAQSSPHRVLFALERKCSRAQCLNQTTDNTMKSGEVYLKKPHHLFSRICTSANQFFQVCALKKTICCLIRLHSFLLLFAGCMYTVVGLLWLL